MQAETKGLGVYRVNPEKGKTIVAPDGTVYARMENGSLRKLGKRTAKKPTSETPLNPPAKAEGKE